VLPCTLDEAAEHAARILGGPYEPAALEWVSDPGALLVRVEGTEAALPDRVARLQELLGPAAVPVEGASAAPSNPTAPSAASADGPSSATLADGPSNGGAHSDARAPDLAAASGASGTAAGPGGHLSVDEAARLAFSRTERPRRRNRSDESGARREPRAGTGTVTGTQVGSAARAGRVDDPWAGHTRLTRGTLDDAVLRIGVRPSRLRGALTGLPARSVTAGLGTGVATVALPADPAAVAAAHAAVHAAGGTSVLRNRPAGFDGPAWGPPPSALAVLRAVKKELDPTGRLGPGRFAPWLTEGAS